jgi:hypothetical protein
MSARTGYAEITKASGTPDFIGVYRRSSAAIPAFEQEK